MGKSKEVDLLKELLNKVSHLKSLNHDNDEYRIWHDQVVVTLETLYGRNSREFKSFVITVRSFRYNASDSERQQDYISFLNQDERNLKSIINMIETRRKIRGYLRYKLFLQWFKSYLITKPFQWIKSHKILSIIITAIMLLAAIITIVSFVKGFFS